MLYVKHLNIYSLYILCIVYSLYILSIHLSLIYNSISMEVCFRLLVIRQNSLFIVVLKLQLGAWPVS